LAVTPSALRRATVRRILTGIIIWSDLWETFTRRQSSKADLPEVTDRVHGSALPRVFHWTQATQRKRRLIQLSRDCNSRHWLKPT